jgi:hypothetical protein
VGDRSGRDHGHARRRARDRRKRATGTAHEVRSSPSSSCAKCVRPRRQRFALHLAPGGNHSRQEFLREPRNISRRLDALDVAPELGWPIAGTTPAVGASIACVRPLRWLPERREPRSCARRRAPQALAAGRWWPGCSSPSR